MKHLSILLLTFLFSQALYAVLPPVSEDELFKRADYVVNAKVVRFEREKHYSSSFDMKLVDHIIVEIEDVKKGDASIFEYNKRIHIQNVNYTDIDGQIHPGAGYIWGTTVGNKYRLYLGKSESDRTLYTLSFWGIKPIDE
ncbi:hypothetical protein JYT19_00795 [Sulfobacillus acidophilus]|uniref:DUF4879 domain-containing protein n=1 Tax=Sulfobacillus acidophilus TaxID=53633 RepID=A0ABS3AYU0_9FIRM|nr:hypothetical protein [Sulfobacillus acidophilus]